ncbi:hypothetical protein MCOR02_006266 [Pyricularia oryzae]|nr:hypothetical protein MCOR02_006266 [Pyricularia oryzae]KAI6307130.1 hypothetical protein MCOR29_009801 [Pyricularia oryzae]KAI6316234.1 hypothetical protein MCOR34_004377 [Pyricularia oryzae]KAI6343115.1 hypothetical protein MCOR30_001559 [Pyricularia oryzae]KAI6367300.1 hypothetical protein MCOR32_007204 [Pyricularia oryzae]
MHTEKAQTPPSGERPPSPDTYLFGLYADQEALHNGHGGHRPPPFSTLGSFIYFPALTQLAESLSVSIDAINLTITSYMAVATVAPTLLGDAVDVLGRTPACVFSLSLYVVTNLATALSRSYVTVLVLRLFQAFAISGELETQWWHFFQNILVELGVGWTFTLMCGWCVLIMALFFLD